MGRKSNGNEKLEARIQRESIRQYEINIFSYSVGKFCAAEIFLNEKRKKERGRQTIDF